MKNKLIFSIGIILIFLLCISINFASEEKMTVDYYGELEPKDYGEFTMDTPSKIEFKEYTGLYDSHVFYKKNLMMVYIFSKDKVNPDYVRGYQLDDAQLIHPETVSDMDFSSKMKFYKEHRNQYVASYENKDYLILIRYDYLYDLVDMTRTIQIDSDSPSFSFFDNTMSIISGTITTGSGLSDKTDASIYVGEEFAGQDVIIQIYYSRDGSLLNNGNMVPKTVTSTGYIDVSSADSYKYYPDNAEINLYDSNNNLLDSKTVDLSPTSGSQYF